MPAHKLTAARMLAMIAKDTSGCWLWTGGLNWKGYGKAGENTSAHRRLYELLRGPIPVGLDLDHICRVRRCVNPDHLEPVTRKENIRRGNTGLARRLRQLARTQCRHGHPYTPDNTRIGSHGERICRECQRQAMTAFLARRHHV